MCKISMPQAEEKERVKLVTLKGLLAFTNNPKKITGLISNFIEKHLAKLLSKISE